MLYNVYRSYIVRTRIIIVFEKKHNRKKKIKKNVTLSKIDHNLLYNEYRYTKYE